MKNHLRFLALLLLLFTESFLAGQNNVQIFQDQASTEPSAILNVASENKGILIPRMTSSQRAAILNPADGLMVFQTDGIEGFYYCIDNSWEKVQDESESVPIGTVIEWWRPDASFPVPEGYAICDGALITDVESPLNGTFLPDLIDNFVKGVTDVNAIGDDHAGYHSHTVDPSAVTLSTAGAHSHILSFDLNFNHAGGHTHTMDPGPVNTSTNSHNHLWSIFQAAAVQYYWWSYSSGGLTNLRGIWTNGVDGAGVDYFTLGVDGVLSGGQDNYYTNIDQHSHSVDIGSAVSSEDGNHPHSTISVSPQISSTGNHHHTLDIPGISTHNMSEVNPPYYGLVKIIRIK